MVREQRTTELDKAFVYTYYGCMGKLPNTLKSSHHLTPKQKKFAEVMVAKWGQITKAEAVREAGYTPKRDNGASELAPRYYTVLIKSQYNPSKIFRKSI